MANQKSAAKANTKSKAGASRLSSIKNALFGAAKKKPETKKPATKAVPAKAQPKAAAVGKTGKAAGKQAKAAPTPAPAKGKATTNGKAAAPAKVVAPQPKGKGQAVEAPAKAGKPAKAVRGASARSGVDAEAVCREVACEGLATTASYCRMHYIKNWKKIKRKEVILKEGKLNQYIEELVAKYPDKYIEAIRHDLAHDKDFAKVIRDLDLDESVDDFEGEGEGSDAIIDSIKRDFDDEGDTGF